MLSLLSSCGLLERTKKALLPGKKKEETVPRSQYEALLKKYEGLRSELAAAKGNDPYQDRELRLHEKLSVKGKQSSGSPLSSHSTVAINDEFSEKESQVGPHGRKTDKKMILGGQQDSLNRELRLLKEGIDLYQKQNHLGALKILETMLESQNPQVRVRALFYGGMSYFEQGEHSRALAYFDRIIKENSFSSLVLTALKYASLSAKALGNQKKSELYNTFLTQTFRVK